MLTTAFQREPLSRTQGGGQTTWICVESLLAQARNVTLSLMRPFFRKQAHSRVRLAMKPQHPERAAEPLRTGGSMLGPLETRLLELLWAQRRPATVAQIRRALPELAYTTIMTTLDRLYRKGLLLRDKDGRAFAYAPRYTRAELLSELISAHVADLLGAEEGAVLLSTLVRAVGRTDAALLDELDALVQAERLRLRTDAK